MGVGATDEATRERVRANMQEVVRNASAETQQMLKAKFGLDLLPVQGSTNRFYVPIAVDGTIQNFVLQVTARKESYVFRLISPDMLSFVRETEISESATEAEKMAATNRLMAPFSNELSRTFESA